MVISQYHPVIGGAERQAHKLAKQLILTDINVHILTVNLGGRYKKYEIIEHKEMQKLAFWINLFFITDIDKHVRPKDRKE